MINFLPFRSDDEPFRVLCLGAHSDDIEIGCGATLISLIEACPNCEIMWVVFSAAGERVEEARRSACLFTNGAQKRNIEVLNFRDGFFPYEGDQIKEYFESLKTRFVPDLVLTHYGNDRHQDHRLLSELSWNTFRDHMILEYEIPKYDGDLANPNLFVPLDQNARGRKINLLMDVFGSQRSKRWFSPETFDALMRLRGIECASPTGYAEAFHTRKMVMCWGN